MFINFKQAGGGGVYSRAVFINFKQGGGGGVYLRAAFYLSKHGIHTVDNYFSFSSSNR